MGNSIFARYCGFLVLAVSLGLFCWSGQAEAAQSYTVKSGDTLWSLSRTWGVSVEKIKAANGLKGDILKDGRQLIIPGISAARNSKPRAASRGGYRDIVGLAQNFLGIPYVTAGSSPQQGFDCSGFTQYVYSLNGIRLPRTAASQYSIGMPVSRNNLSSGDLVFFNTSYGVSHVGIYMGDDNFIHASASRGIAIGNLNNSYWVGKYLGARRIL